MPSCSNMSRLASRISSALTRTRQPRNTRWISLAVSWRLVLMRPSQPRKTRCMPSAAAAVFKTRFSRSTGSPSTRIQRWMRTAARCLSFHNSIGLGGATADGNGRDDGDAMLFVPPFSSPLPSEPPHGLSSTRSPLFALFDLANDTATSFPLSASARIDSFSTIRNLTFLFSSRCCLPLQPRHTRCTVTAAECARFASSLWRTKAMSRPNTVRSAFPFDLSKLVALQEPPQLASVTLAILV